MSKSLLLLCLSGAAMVNAQAPAVSAPGTGVVVGAGNFFSPIVSSVERAAAFYRDGLGLVSAQPGLLISNADANAPLRDMFGLPSAKLRWTVVAPSGMRNGIEIIEITQAGGRALDRRIQDPGAMTLVRPVGEFEAVLMRLKGLGATVVSTDGAAVKTGGAQMILVREPDDHFVELFALGRGAGPGDARVRLTVSNLDRAVALYRDALGLRGNVAEPTRDPALLRMLGLSSGTVRMASLEVPGSPVILELVEFNGVDRRIVNGSIQDPGSTRMQLQVRDLDAAIQAVVGAGGAVISTGGKPVELPAGRGGSIRAAMVRDPDHLFLVLIESRPQP